MIMEKCGREEWWEDGKVEAERKKKKCSNCTKCPKNFMFQKKKPKYTIVQ